MIRTLEAWSSENAEKPEISETVISEMILQKIRGLAISGLQK